MKVAPAPAMEITLRSGSKSGRWTARRETGACGGGGGNSDDVSGDDAMGGGGNEM